MVFTDCIDDFLVVNMDDLLIYDSDTLKHSGHVTTVLRRLRDNNLFAKMEKCYFDEPCVPFIGFLVSEKGLEMDAKKVSTVLEWNSPINVREVQRFLGCANFYRRFIRNYSAIAAPLTQLTRKGIFWQWGEKQTKCILLAKKCFLYGSRSNST